MNAMSKPPTDPGVVKRLERSRTLNLSHDGKILPGQTVQIATSPNRGSCAFLPLHIEILTGGQSASGWIVSDVKIGHRSQFERPSFRRLLSEPSAHMMSVLGCDTRYIPGQTLRLPNLNLAFDEIAVGEAMSITVTYIGDRQDGAPFRCFVHGSEVSAPAPALPRRRHLGGGP